ncbi:MAG: class I adenylate-forming enzyme family protein [Pseudomonadales bacterium]
MMSTPMQVSISDYVFTYGLEYPGRVAMSSEFGDLSYGELSARVQQLAQSLLALGIKPGDRVAVLTTPRADAYSLFIALNAVGAIWVGINPVYQYEEMAYVVSDAQPVALVFLSEFQGRSYTDDVKRLANEHPCLNNVLCLDSELKSFQSLPGLLEERIASRSTDLALPKINEDDVAMIVYTSGSTGQPKGCMLPNKAMVYRANVQWQQFKVSDYPRVFCPLPLNHVGGMQMVAGAALIGGGTVNFRQKFNPAEVGDVIQAGQINFMVMFPTMYQLLIDDPTFDREKYNSLECINFSGGVISRELLEQLRQLGNGRVQTCFGSTETCVGVVFSDPDLDPEVLAISVGKPINDDCRVMSDLGEHCKAGEVGEFQVKPDYCMVGYFKRPEATKEAFTSDGWLRSGDLVEVLPDGNFKFSARRSEMYKSGGYNIYPREVEICIESHPDVISAAVVGIPDKLYGEVGYAYVLAPEGKDLAEQVLKSWCKDKISNYKVPKIIEKVQAMPLLPNGKLDKVSLRAKAEST